MDAGQRGREAAPMWMPSSLLTRAVEVGRPPPHGHRAERVEGDVAQVEQAGEADHEVEPERHNHVGEREDAVIHEASSGSRVSGNSTAATRKRRGQDVLRPRLGGVPRWRSSGLLVSSPIRPCGLKTMISTR